MNDGKIFDEETVGKIEKTVGFHFRDKELLKRCFTLSSRSKKNNERLEFLGDALLEAIVSEELYFRSEAEEGEMTSVRQTLVSDETLREVVLSMGLEEYLDYAGRTECNLGKKPVASLFEALTAGIYLEGGMSAAKAFVSDKLLSSVSFGERETPNYKGRLQEYLQAEGSPFAKYGAARKSGPDHRPVFEVCAEAKGRKACGRGESKKAAEQEAAKRLLEELKKQG